MISKNLYLPVFNRRITIIKGNKEEIINWYWDQYKNLLEVIDGFDAFSMSSEDGYYICFENKIGLYALIHEVGHIVFDICSDLGINCDASHAETFLYLQEYIIRESLNLLTSDPSIDDILDVTFDLLEDKIDPNINTCEK